MPPVTKHPLPNFSSYFGGRDGSGGELLLFNTSYGAAARIGNGVYKVA